MSPQEAATAGQSKPGLVPIPDPSVLTTEALRRDLGGLRELLEERLRSVEDAAGHVREIIETRLDGMDKAIRLLQDLSDKFPARIDEKIAARAEVHEEKFRSIAKQFEERDVRSDGSKRDGKDALDAALAAQKEAAEKQASTFGLSVAKSEAATDKRIDQMGQLIQTTAGGLEGKLMDVKDRITRIEGAGAGERRQADVQQTSTAAIVGIIGLILGTVIGAAGLIAAFVRH